MSRVTESWSRCLTILILSRVKTISYRIDSEFNTCRKDRMSIVYYSHMSYKNHMPRSTLDLVSSFGPSCYFSWKLEDEKTQGTISNGCVCTMRTQLKGQ